jgi:hypothetical protein
MRYAIIPILFISLAAYSQADARGGGDGHGVVVVRTSNATVIRRPGFVRRQPVARFAHAVPNRFNKRFNNNGQLVNGWGWGWPVWWTGDSDVDQPTGQAQEPPVQPEVIVIRTDGQGRLQTAEATTPDISYVKSCHAIPNGYHCDLPSESRQ